MPTRTERLTGSTRHRTGWFGKQILQVEICGEYECPHTFDMSPTFYGWRDAKSYEVPAKTKGD